MLAIPSALQTQFEEYLRNKATPNRLQGEYKKWLQYYMDFCQKYKFGYTPRRGCQIRSVEQIVWLKKSVIHSFLSDSIWAMAARGC